MKSLKIGLKLEDDEEVEYIALEDTNYEDRV